jgi:opacity protein-like surface antigen
MTRLVMLFALVLALGGSLYAQDVPKVEGFIGGSVMNIDDSGFKLTPFGWQGSVNGNFHNNVGIVGDFSGNYRKGIKIHSFLGGVQFTKRAEKTSVFAQAKAGGVRFNDSTSSDTNFQLGFGGGVDWNINDKVSFRVIQIDWLPVKESGAGGGWVKNLTRAGIGIVIKGAAR